jgi:hypothetical protein
MKYAPHLARILLGPIANNTPEAAWREEDFAAGFIGLGDVPVPI